MIVLLGVCGGGQTRGWAAQADAVEPVRRDPTVVVEHVPMLFGSPAFEAAHLVIPRTTTAELADFVRSAGAPGAAQWLCAAYTATPPASDSPAGSLVGLIDIAASAGPSGEEATDALVCPRLRRHLRETIHKNDLGCLFGPFPCHSHITRYTRISHDLAYPACAASEAQRQAFDAASCELVLLGRTGRASALRVFLRRARRRNGCLDIAVNAYGRFATQLLVREGCD